MGARRQPYAVVPIVLAVLAASGLSGAQAQSCKATYELSTPWQTGGNTFYSVNFYITNTGSQTIATPWNLAIYSSAYVAVTQVSLAWLAKAPLPISDAAMHQHEVCRVCMQGMTLTCLPPCSDASEQLWAACRRSTCSW